MNESARNKVDPPDIDTIREELESLRKTVSALTREAGNGAIDKAAGRGHRLYTRVHDGGERVARAASDEIEEHPLTSVLIAFAIGFVGGRLLPHH